MQNQIKTATRDSWFVASIRPSSSAGWKNQLLFGSLGDMTDKYGASFTIHPVCVQGTVLVIISSSWEVAEECLSTDDTVTNR